MYSLMIAWSKTAQALDFSLDVPAGAGQLSVSQRGLRLWPVLAE